MAIGHETIDDESRNKQYICEVLYMTNQGHPLREYSSKPLKHSNVKRILVVKR